jgi:hypothetical protein
MLGRLNSFLKSIILRVNEARDLDDENRYQFYDHLKAYTAAPPDVLRPYVFSFGASDCFLVKSTDTAPTRLCAGQRTELQALGDYIFADSQRR